MRALCLMHDNFSSPGLIGEALLMRGWSLDVQVVVPPHRFDSPNVEFAFPEPRDFDVIIPFGAPWAAYDDEGIGSWLLPEIEWIQKALAGSVPVFGVCFGGQLLARACGAEVRRSEFPEIGWTDVTSTNENALESGEWFQWHYDTFELPHGATLSAHNASAIQAFEIGNSFGTQFHPELTPSILDKWLDNGGNEQLEQFGLVREDIRARTLETVASAQRRTEKLVNWFLDTRFPS